MYSLAGQKVYVLQVKRIRLGHETYTFWGRSLYLSGGEAFRRQAYPRQRCLASLNSGGARGVQASLRLKKQSPRRYAHSIASGAHFLGFPTSSLGPED